MEKSFFGTGMRVALLPVLHRHLQRHFHCGGAIVRIEDPCEALGSNANQLFRQKNSRRIGKTKEGAMGNGVQLRDGGTIKSRVPMSVQIDPKG